MNAKELIKKLKSIKKELQEKPIFIMAENGVLIQPEIYFHLKDASLLNKTKENVEYLVLN